MYDESAMYDDRRSSFSSFTEEQLAATRSVESLSKLLLAGQVVAPYRGVNEESVLHATNRKKAPAVFVRSASLPSPAPAAAIPAAAAALRKGILTNGTSSAAASAATTAAKAKPVDYHVSVESTFHRMVSDLAELDRELFSAKQRILEPLAIKNRASLSIMHVSHLRRVPPAASERPVRLNIVAGPPHEWVAGSYFAPGVQVSLTDTLDDPVYAWSASVRIRAYLLNGVGDIVREMYDATALLGDEAVVVGNVATFGELRVMVPSAPFKCGWFRLAFVACDFAIEGVVSDRFEISEAPLPRDPAYLYDMDTAVALRYATAGSLARPTHAVFEVTPMHIACARARPELVQLLLDKGDRVNGQGPAGITPLHLSCYLGAMPVVRLLLANGADPDAVCEAGNTILHYAVLSGSAELVEYLVHETPVRKDRENRSGMQAVHFAARANLVPALSLFRDELNARVRRDGQTPAHVAAFHGWTDTLAALCSLGADLRLRSRHGWTLAHFAALGGSLAVLEQLPSLGLGALDDVDAPVPDLGFTPLHICALRGHESLLKQLMRLGADARRIASNGQTAAHLAAISGDKDTLETVLAGPNADLEDAEVRTLTGIFVFESFTKTSPPVSDDSDDEIVKKLVFNILSL